MAEQRIFDPRLGEDRDAFPGEVVDPEKQSTLQRLMAEEEERFTADLAEVKATGKFSPDDENAVRRFAKLRAEVQRAKYLEALNSNPANLLQNALKELAKSGDTIPVRSLITLDENINKLQNGIVVEKASDKMSGESQDTEAKVKKYLGRPGTIDTLIYFDLGGNISVLQRTSFELIKKLGFLPLESLSSFSDLYSAVRTTNNNDRSGKPYLFENNPFAIRNLSSNIPGLEGINANINFTNGQFLAVNSFRIFGTPQALARIVDKGQYVPYQNG